MKRLTLLIIAVVALSACSDKKEREKAILDDVIKIHDKVMAADDQLMNNKTLLDSMVKYNSTANIKDSVYFYLDKINLTDSLMGEWMHKFDPEQTGKTDDQKLIYFQREKIKLMLIDSQMSTVVEHSNKYLTKLKIK